MKPDPIGLIAGNGQFPIFLAEEAARKGQPMFVAALKEEADPSITKLVAGSTWVSIGQLQGIIDYFKSCGVAKAIMAGQVKHVQLFKGILPDWRAVKLLAKVRSKKAEDLLRAVTEEFAADGIEFLPSVSYLEHWLATEGLLSKRRLSESEEKDIEFGKPIARQLADSDIGQTLIVKDQTIVAVEAMEGTDAAIRRAGEIAGPGCVVIKVARSRQDLRFDVPVIGERTLASLQAAKAAVLAVEIKKTLLLDRDNLIQQANNVPLSVVGISF